MTTLAAESKLMLDLAARLALRSAGYVEPNPMVGAVIVNDGRIIGMGHHRHFGGLHAEVEALEDCRQRGEDPRGATVYVTLEPCNHQGKQPPCTEALIAARVAKVVCAREDPNPIASGGAARLRLAGIEVEFTDASINARRLSDPFVKLVTTGLPWVIVKWAQTIDGRVATRAGESKWISCEASRRRVHRVRARVDAVLTGIGTVLADNPALTARAGWYRRRVARRVIIDPDLEIGEDSLLVQTLDEAPLTVICSDEALAAGARKVSVLTARGVEVVGMGPPSEIEVDAVLRMLVDKYHVSNVLVEAGPGLNGRLIDGGLADELHVFVAPTVFADELAKAAARGSLLERLSDARRYQLCSVRRVQDDVQLTYRRPTQVESA